MPKKGIIIAVTGLGIILGAYYLLPLNGSCQDFDQGTIYINETHSITVAYAATKTEQAKGLSGCSSLKLGQGMYFPFSQKFNAVFWMKNMIIPIDIIWISDNKVIGIEHNVPTPTGDNLTKYYAPKAVDAVLEIGAGHANRLGITEGANIQAQ